MEEEEWREEDLLVYFSIKGKMLKSASPGLVTNSLSHSSSSSSCVVMTWVAGL